jgi:hypothetical protein
MAERQSWQRRLDLRETAQAYHAFQHFRDLPPRVRSLDRAYTACLAACPREHGRIVNLAVAGKGPEAAPVQKEAPGRWKVWRKRYLWDARAADADAFLEAETREEMIEAVREMNKRFAMIARACTGKIVERLQSIAAADLTPGQLITWLEKCSAVERLARGVPTAILQQAYAGGTVPTDLSQLSEEELLTLEGLIEKAHAAPK